MGSQSWTLEKLSEWFVTAWLSVFTVAFHLLNVPCHEEEDHTQNICQHSLDTFRPLRCWTDFSDLAALGAEAVAGYPFTD